MWRRIVIATFGVMGLMAPTACAQETQPASPHAQAAAALRSGKYADAVTAARRALAANPASVRDARVLVQALLLTGAYAEAEDAGLAFVRANPSVVDLHTLLGDVHARRGRLDLAEAAWKRAAEGAADSLTAVVRLAQLRFDRGDIDAAMRAFDRFIDIYNARRSTLTASELQAVAVACRYLGRDDPQLFKDALKAYDEAITKDTFDLEPRVRLAELFLEKYNAADARETLDEVLRVNPRHPGALLAMARLRHFDFHRDAADLAGKSLEVNPAFSEARAFSALLLVDVERYEDATAEARRGLTHDSLAYEPLVALAAARFLAGDRAGHQSALERALARKPKSAEAEATLADVMARNRLYGDAVRFARRAIDRDAKSSRALAFLGVNALRVGDIAEGRGMLERAFALDPYDVWAKNTLDLLDTFKDYDEIPTRRFVIAVERRDAPLLTLYMEPLIEAAYDSLAARYGFRPQPPVRVEVYRRHADFSVRTVGLMGLGALGVSFGNVVAMDGPAARRQGEFNWGSTLWHELAHTFTLGASENRVPRWLSEGLSVYEERRARAGWGDDVSPEFIAAFKGGLLVPLARLNDGFMRPTFPQQIQLSYYQASLLCELIERDFGLEALRGLLAQYRSGAATDAAIRAALKTDIADLQRRFDAYLRTRFARELDAVDAAEAPRDGAPGIIWDGKLADALRTASALASANQWAQAIPALDAAKALFPSYAGEDSPYALLAKGALARADTARAIAELEALTGINENAYGANLQLAALHAKRGDARRAAAALERAMYIFPHELEPHVQLAELAAQAGDHTITVRERRAVLALDPTDRVDALYQLALAYMNAGNRDAARREVVRALELAPNFEKAQELLLRLRGGGS